MGLPSADGGALSPAISTVHSDIMHTHILTHLDGLTLASIACASTHLYSLIKEDKLWRDLSSSTWPSINDPRVQHVISTFPSGHRSLFSDSFSVLNYRETISGNSINGSCDKNSDKLISAVDIFYNGELVFSKVKETETITSRFTCSPFRVDLLEPKESFLIEIPDNEYQKDTWQTVLLENLRLSWILIDPARKRAVNLSSNKPVFEEQKWLTGEMKVKFATVVPGGGKRGTAEEVVECAVMVTCGLGTEGKVHVSEVSLSVQDMEERNLRGKDSLVIFRTAMERVRSREADGYGKKRYQEFVKMKRAREIKKAGRLNILDAWLILIGLLIFVWLCWVLVFRKR